MCVDFFKPKFMIVELFAHLLQFFFKMKQFKLKYKK